MRQAFLRARARQPPTSSLRSPSLFPLYRSLATPSHPAQAALAQVKEDDDMFPYYSTPSPSRSTRSHLTILPSPLPIDQPATAQNLALYPNTLHLDSLVMISVCLKRPSTIPRAYSIFVALLTSHENQKSAFPDAKVFGELIAALVGESENIIAHDKGIGRGGAAVWRDRGIELVRVWEQEKSGSSTIEHAAALQDEGHKVYAGLLRGCIDAGISTSPLLPYLVKSSALTPQLLTKSYAAYDLPMIYARLKNDAMVLQMEEVVEVLEKAERDLKAVEDQLVVESARDLGAEVTPVEKTKTSFTVSEMVAAAEHPKEVSSEAKEARFAITNLRQSLLPITARGALLPMERQRALEVASLEAARAELRHSHEELSKASNSSGALESQAILSKRKLQAWMWEWLGEMTTKVAQKIQEMEERQQAKKDAGHTPQSAITSTLATGKAATVAKEADLLLYLNLLGPEKLALITILETMRLGGSAGIPEGMKVVRAVIGISSAVECEYRIGSIKDLAGIGSEVWQGTLHASSHKPDRRHISTVWKKIEESLAGERPEGAKRSILEEQAIDPMRQVWTPDWTRTTHVAVGGFLLDCLKDAAFITRERWVDGEMVASERQPAFYHAYEYVRGMKLGVIKLNPEVLKRIAKDRTLLTLGPKHLPMLVPPLPWKGVEDGGYLLHHVTAMRFKEGQEQKTYMKQAVADGKLNGVLAGLDVLSATPWAINRNVYDVIIKAWNEGSAIADIPAADHNLQHQLPAKPASNQSPQERGKYIERIKAIHMQIMKDHSERCKFNYTLEIARSFLNDVFYIPHSMDFRGRAYPIPPHLSPVGDDLCRGLLTFGVKKPLGPDGLRWLRIQLANVYGYDKASFSDREAFAIKHEADVFDSADSPLEGSRWWLKAEDPWQCLATCFELVAALRSDDPSKFLSSLPVHQDGTCNGMQHYAALGGDSRGAKAVNLEVGDKPADLYTGVADLVNVIVNKDAAMGKHGGMAAQGRVTRKVVKQTVMTTVYGVTFVGAKNQVARQFALKGELTPEQIFPTSSYIAKTVLQCIGDLFGGAKDIQTWLTTCARLISRCVPPDRIEYAVQQYQPSRGSKVYNKREESKKPSRLSRELMTSVTWTTPLGLPVVQPYRKPLRKQIMTALQSVYISDPNEMAEISPLKQAMAFPPNFVHSLDATHLLQTALKCHQQGMTFASVHDSYWTHASTVAEMSKITRDEFIRLHNKDIIGDLRKEFLERFGDHLLETKSVLALLKTRDTLMSKQAAMAAAALSGRHEAVDDEDGVDSESTVDPDYEPTIVKTKKPKAKTWRSTSDGIFNPDDEHVPDIKIGGKSFMRLADVLPLAPVRGDFDVNRVRDSPYFFS